VLSQLIRVFRKATSFHPTIFVVRVQAHRIGLGEKFIPPPLGDDPDDNIPVFIRQFLLFGRHRDKNILVPTGGQFVAGQIFCASNQEGRQRAADGVQFLITLSPTTLPVSGLRMGWFVRN
jgi:hypothetical protein